MAEMAISMCGPNLFERHAIARIGVFDNIVSIDGLCEAWPPRVAVEFVYGCEQRLTGHYINVDTRLFVVPVFVLKWPFGSIALRYAVLFRRQSG
jgi:hypothetical protein